MSCGFQRLLRRFWHDERGAAMFMFTAVVVPLLLVVAVAIDLSQILVVKRQLTGAVDSAALTLGVLPSLDDGAAHDKAESYVRAHYKEAIGTLTGVTVTRADTIINVTATSEIPMTFLRVAGYDKVTVAVSSQAIRKEKNIELVMVLDNTGSMAGTKIEALKAASNMLVATLMPGSTSEQVKIGLVPFVGSVNVGADRRGAAWLDETHPSALNNENITSLGAGVSLFTLFDALKQRNSNITWRGCLRARTEPFDTQDTPPDPLDSRTLFTPYFAPDEASFGYNDYIRSSFDPRANDQADYTKYSSMTASITSTTGPNTYCPHAPIQPLTNVRATILAAIEAMNADGNTVIPEGLAWGWRVISPGAPFTEGVDYDQDDTIKVIVLMTDGENNVTQGYNAPNNSVFSAYGYRAPQKHLGTDATATLNSKLTAICTNIKAIKRADNQAAVVIYTVAFGNPPESIKALLSSCASAPSHFFDTPTNDDLKVAFEMIANSLNELRVAR